MKTTEDQLLDFIGRIEDELEENEDVLLQKDEAKRLVSLMRQASNTNEETVMFAVLVKTEARSDVCEDGKFWVKDETHEYYVSERERGLWKSKDDAGKAVTESYEEIVEVKMKTNEQKLHDFADRIESELNRNGDVVLDRQEAERLVKLMRESANEIFHFYQPVNNEQNHV